MTSSPRNAALVTAGGAAALILLPALSLRGYTDGDPYLCGDLGSMGAQIGGVLQGVFVFAVCVAIAAAVAGRAQVLLALPLGLVAHWYLTVLGLPLRVTISPCDDGTSLLGAAIVVGVSGALAYALGRPAVTDDTPDP